MKILIGTEDIAGWIPLFKVGFEQLGHTVTTAVVRNNRFYDHEYDYNLYQLFLCKFELNKKNSIFHKVFNKLKKFLILIKYKIFVKKIISETDVVVYLWHTFNQDMSDMIYAKKMGKKVICLFVGSDVRYWKAFEQEFNVSHWQFPNFWTQDCIKGQLKYIRTCEKYADSIYSVPDQAGLQIRPYYHLQVPVNVDGDEVRKERNNRIKIIHAPSNPFKKGTDIIENSIDKLIDNGYQIEFISTRDLPHIDLLDLLEKADVLIDEIVFHGPGALSFEAMVRGCVVVTRHLENSPIIFQPPVIAANADNLYEKLEILLDDVSVIEKLAIQGRSYAFNNNRPEIFAATMINDLCQARKPDYVPRFFIEKYCPISKKEIKIINNLNTIVKDLDWYRLCVNNFERDGLYF